MEKSKWNNLKSSTHNIHDESITRRYIILDPNKNLFDEIMKKIFNNYKNNYARYLVSCLLKLLTTTNHVRYIRINEKPNVEYFLNFSTISILSRINVDQFYFSHIYELGITFSSSFRDMTYAYYLKQRKATYESKLNQILAENPRHIFRLYRYSPNPNTRKYINHEIIFANERNWEQTLIRFMLNIYFKKIRSLLLFNN